MTNGWFAPQFAGECSASRASIACFPEPAAMPTTQAACEAAGCCWAGPTYILVQLYYSSIRHDHFSSTNDCSGCGGANYTFIRNQGAIISGAISNETVAIQAYWNPDVADNVLATAPPSQPGYTLVAQVGYIYTASAPSRLPVKLWYNTALQHHFTTFLAADEADAQAANFTFVTLMGYAASAAAANNTVSGCYQRSGSSDWYFFGHGADYAQALADYAALGGALPLPRRHFLGMSWSRWGNQLTQDVALDEVASLKAAGFPLDTFVFDMQWHLKPDWTGTSGWFRGRVEGKIFLFLVLLIFRALIRLHMGPGGLSQPH